VDVLEATIAMVEGRWATASEVTTLSLARAYDERGDAAQAVAHYREFIELWKDADPELQPRVAEVRARLRVLTPVEGRR
jgi:hypothetical protein